MICGGACARIRNAELALFRRQPYEAEAILIQSQLFYRAIKMWVRLFNWDRALELSVQHAYGCLPIGKYPVIFARHARATSRYNTEIMRD